MLQSQIKLQYGSCCFIKQDYRNEFGEEEESEFNFTLQLNLSSFVNIINEYNVASFYFYCFFLQEQYSMGKKYIKEKTIKEK